MIPFLANIRAYLIDIDPRLWPLAIAVVTGAIVFGIGKVWPLKEWSKALQAVPALLISAALSGLSATEVVDMLIDAVLGAFSGVLAIGGHHTMPRLAELLKALVRRGSGQAALLVALALPAGLTGCSAFASAVPVISMIAGTVDRISTEIERMDGVVQATFDVYPEIGAVERAEWLTVMDTVRTARLAVLRAAEAAESLDDGDLHKALAQLEVAIKAAQDWMRRHGMLDGQGRYVVAGQVISQQPAVSSFRAE